MKYILAIDIGTTALKASVVREDGRICGCAAVEYAIITPQAGWAEMEVDTYLSTFEEAVHEAMKKAAVPAEDIATIGMSSQGETTIFLDKEGRPLRRSIIWFDTRAEEEAREIVGNFGAKSIRQHTGQVGVDAIWPGAKLLWLRKHEPQTFENLGMAVQLKGYFSYLLTGRAACEDSILGSSIYWDINTRKYWPEMLDFIGINERQLPEILRPGEIAGHLTQEAALRFGLSNNTTLSIGGIDLACGAIGVGNIRPGIFSDSTGSALCTVTMADHPVLDPSMQMPCYCSAFPGKYMIHAYSTGGMFMRWFRDVFCELEIAVEHAGGENAYDQLDRLAEQIPAGSDGLIALPHLQGSGPPDQNSAAKAVFCGITIAHQKGHFVRAIMEGVTMVLCRMMQATRDLGVPIDSIITYGGGAKSRIWTQIKADATGLPVITTKHDEQATCLGAAILAGCEAGMWDSVEEAAGLLVQQDTVYQPDPDVKPVYDELLQKYVQLMDALQPVWK